MRALATAGPSNRETLAAVADDLQDAPGGKACGSQQDPSLLIYLDPRAFTRDCVARWLQSSLRGLSVCALADPDDLETVPGDHQIEAVLVSTGPEPVAATRRRVSRIRELLPTAPLALLSDRDDAESIREAFELGVQGFIPTSLPPLVAVGAVQLVAVGGTFAPPAPLLSTEGRRPRGVDEPPIKGFSRRQSEILACLRRGMANKQIAHELDVRESTVKVHLRHIMKKLDAKNRTQVVCLMQNPQTGEA